jgi:hypothetical protein
MIYKRRKYINKKYNGNQDKINICDSEGIGDSKTAEISVK